jgi:DNA-binding CsgD family transcriptional regulator
MGLSDLGVADEDERVYRFFLREPDTAPERAAEELRTAPDAVVAAMRRLAALGLLTELSDGTVHVSNPQPAVEDLITRRLTEVNDELRRIAATRVVLPSLESERSGTDPLELIERIPGPAGLINARIHEIGEHAREILSIQSARRTGVGADELERMRRRLQAGISYRTIVYRGVLENPEVDAYFRALHRAGDHHRVIDEPLWHLIVVDRKAAFLPVDADPLDVQGGAILIRQPSIVNSLVALFEQTWTRAVDLEPIGDPEISAVERQVLDLLIRVDKDETAAREMGISVRTFRRHVAALMLRLGATNRFHAAYLARDRGWI